MTKVMRKEARHTQRRDRASGVPLDILEHLPPKPAFIWSYSLSEVRVVAERSYPMPKVRAAAQTSYHTPEVTLAFSRGP